MDSRDSAPTPTAEPASLQSSEAAELAFGIAADSKSTVSDLRESLKNNKFLARQFGTEPPYQGLTLLYLVTMHSDDVEKVKYLITECKANILEKMQADETHEGRDVVFTAAKHGRQNILAYLLKEHKAKVNILAPMTSGPNNNISPFIVALQSTQLSVFKDMVKHLENDSNLFTRSYWFAGQTHANHYTLLEYAAWLCSLNNNDVKEMAQYILSEYKKREDRAKLQLLLSAREPSKKKKTKRMRGASHVAPPSVVAAPPKTDAAKALPAAPAPTPAPISAPKPLDAKTQNPNLEGELKRVEREYKKALHEQHVAHQQQLQDLEKRLENRFAKQADAHKDALQKQKENYEATLEKFRTEREIAEETLKAQVSAQQEREAATDKMSDEIQSLAQVVSDLSNQMTNQAKDYQREISQLREEIRTLVADRQQPEKNPEITELRNKITQQNDIVENRMRGFFARQAIDVHQQKMLSDKIQQQREFTLLKFAQRTTAELRNNIEQQSKAAEIKMRELFAEQGRALEQKSKDIFDAMKGTADDWEKGINEFAENLNKLYNVLYTEMRTRMRDLEKTVQQPKKDWLRVVAPGRTNIWVEAERKRAVAAALTPNQTTQTVSKQR